MTSWQNSETLKSLGLNKKNEWILHDEKAQGFFQHLATNIGRENLLTEAEWKLFQDLKEAGQFMEGEALDNEIKTLESHFPGILTISNEEIEELERELKFLENDNNERKARIERMKLTEKKQLKDIAAKEAKRFELECKEKQLEQECLKKAGRLMELQKSNSTKIEELKQVYTQPVS